MLIISSRSWVKNPRYKSKKTCSYTKVSMQDEQENNSRQVTTHGNRRTRTHLFSELSDGGQIKVVHFDTKICQGDFGCNERSFPEVMQKQWKRIIPFVCSSWCCLISSNTGKMHLKDEGSSTIPRGGVWRVGASRPKKGEKPTTLP